MYMYIKILNDQKYTANEIQCEIQNVKIYT